MPLQKPFRGLLSYLGELSGGQISFEPSQLMQLVVDAQDFIEPPELLTDDGQLSGTAGDNVPHFVVPDNEAWRLMWFSTNVGQNVNWINSQYSLDLFDPGSGVEYPLAPDTQGAYAPGTSTAGVKMSQAFPRPGLFIRAGSILQTTLASGGGTGNSVASAAAIVQRLNF